MGGVVSSLFGEGGQKGELELEKGVPTLTPEQKKLANEVLLPLLTRALRTSISPSTLESTSLAGLEEFAMQLVGGGVAGAETAGTARSALEGILTQGPQDFEDFFQKTVQDPALEGFQRDIIPAIRERFAPQFFGGERREAEGRATEDLLTQLTRARAGLAFQTQQAGQQNILAALGLTPSLIGAEQVPQANLLTQLLGAGITGRQSIASEEQRRIQNALAFLGQPQIENIAAGIGGTAPRTGLFPAAAAAFAGGYGGTF